MAKDKKELLVSSPLEAGTKDLASVMKEEADKRQLLTGYIGKHMVSGVDFGTIKFGNKESKPSLFKPGSEKFLSLFKLTARFEKDTDTWEMAGSESGVFSYKCLLYAQNGSVVGEGRGISKLSEKPGWTINNAVKIAEKRAQIDAVLRTGALSDFFTQDLEDMVQSYDNSPIAEKAVPTVIYDDPEVKIVAPKSVSTELQKKKRIMDLADSIVLEPLKKEEYKGWIENESGLSLIPSNYDEIITRLEALK